MALVGCYVSTTATVRFARGPLALPDADFLQHTIRRRISHALRPRAAFQAAPAGFCATTTRPWTSVPPSRRKGASSQLTICNPAAVIC